MAQVERRDDQQLCDKSVTASILCRVIQQRDQGSAATHYPYVPRPGSRLLNSERLLRLARHGFVAQLLWVFACAPPAVVQTHAANQVLVRGTVFDSLTSSPLAGGVITLSGTGKAAVESVKATTDSTGSFTAALTGGPWTAAISHPRFDSLRIVLEPQRLIVGRATRTAVVLATPSAATVTRMLCGPLIRDDDVAIVGNARNASTRQNLDSGRVFAKWMNLSVTPRGTARVVVGKEAKMSADGWYVICGVPAKGTVLAWAQSGAAVTGAVPVSLGTAPTRLDFSLDTNSRLSRGSVDLDPDSSGMTLFPMSVGAAQHRVLIRELSGRPVSNARVRILGREAKRSDQSGVALLDSVTIGTQTLEVLAIGFLPERRVVEIAPGGESADTVVVTSLTSVMTPVRITAGRDPNGFDVRRGTRAGQFITAADIVRENPARTTQLLRGRDGIRYTYDRNGYPTIEVSTLPFSCRPLILIDGFPPGPAPATPGTSALDWLLHPDEIGGVEVYTTPGQVPVEFARMAPVSPCAAIAFWTRQRLGLPSVDSRRP